jgi:hypothetical protein
VLVHLVLWPLAMASASCFGRSKPGFSLAVMLIAASASASDAVASGSNQRSLRCIDAWGEARYANYGYDHIVHLRSRCHVRAVCDVATNVNPQPIRVSVPAGREVEVLTYRGSPVREFSPKVSCALGP